MVIHQPWEACGEKWVDIRETKRQPRIPLLKDPDCAATADELWLWYCLASGSELHIGAWLGEASFPFWWMFLRQFMLFTKDCCLCCASVPFLLLASTRLIAPPILMQTQILGRMIRWGSSMGNCTAGDWQTKFASKDCPFIQLIPLLKIPGNWLDWELL